MMLKILKIAFLTSLSLSLPGQLAAQDVGKVVATVDGTEITLGHMIQAYSELPDQYRTLPDDVLWRGILDQLIQQTLLGDTIDDANTSRIEVALENEERGLRAQAAVGAISTAATTEEALQEAYEANYSQGGDKEYNAAHILVETQEEAQALADAAREGAEFAELARENSTGPSGPNGGELGWFGEGRMVAPFETAVKTLKIGGISDPIETQFGWHVIKLNDTRIQEAPAIETVREDLIAQIQTQAIEARISELMQDAEISRMTADEVDPAILKNENLFD